VANKFEKKCDALKMRLVQCIKRLEVVDGIFVKRLRIAVNGPKLLFRVSRLRNSFGEDDMEKARKELLYNFFHFWLTNRVDKFMIDIDLTMGVVDVTIWDWGILWCLEDPQARAVATRMRPPQEHEAEAFLYDDPSEWFPEVIGEHEQEFLHKQHPGARVMGEPR